MKNTVIALLATILLVCIVNLLASLGLLGGGAGGSYEYKALNAPQMDAIGFRTIAEEEGLDVTEEGEINFPKEMVDKIAKVNMLPRTITEVEKDGGWTLVGITADNHYLFRRAK
ncbi:MAG: hypothetical protein P1U87_14080 [Verrucomicrobiales bacterium]|nr:hypothetical protein [Verrucomicrobiales bacterium]